MYSYIRVIPENVPLFFIRIKLTPPISNAAQLPLPTMSPLPHPFTQWDHPVGYLWIGLRVHIQTEVISDLKRFCKRYKACTRMISRD
jgi:hypothetical protein